jgi:branched-chain amino acid transport system permease protein
MEFVATQLVNGLAYGVLLFLMSAGLSLIFGLMNVVNVAHGSFFMLGAFFALAIVQWTGSFWLALALSWIPAMALGVVMERLFIRRLYARGHLDQVLLTFGFTFVFVDLVRMVWGADIHQLPVPDILSGVVAAGDVIIPKYRLFLIAFGGLVAVLLWLFLERSRVGAMVRAGVDDAFTATGIGINVPLLFASIFALGVALAAVGGTVAGPILGLYPGMDIEILIPAFIVVVIGGMGSLRGAFVASIFVGLVDTFGKAYFPDAALFVIYLLMVIVLLTRPQGLFGVGKA